MKNKNKTIKTIFGCTAACSAIMISGAGLMNLQTEKFDVKALSVDSIPVSITNSNFNNNTSSSYPFNPNSYTAYNGNSKVDTSNSSIDKNITMGVINLTNEKYESKFASALRPSLDNYVVMIDSTKEEGGVVTSHYANYGYRTNSSIKLEANSKYMISVDVLTTTNSNIANLYLYDADGEEFSKIENISTNNSWATHTFFVATNNSESIDLTIGMYLKGAGTVLFDNICAFKLSDNEYDFSKDSYTNKVEKDLNDSVIKTYEINADGQIENRSDNSVVSSLRNIEFDSGSTKNTVKDSDGENENAIKIVNSKKTYSQFETDNIFTFAPNRLYKVSINVKTKNLDGTASLQLIRTDLDEDDKNYNKDLNKTIKITSNTYSSSTQSVTNDYKTYSFYINSHSSKTLEFKLKFGLGLPDALTSGEMYVSEIEISKIDYETFNSASESEQINFVDVYSDSKIMLNNGDFNGFKIEDYNAPIPATPIDWTVTTGKNTQKYGVVNTATFDEDFSKLNLSKLRNPSESDNNNVLMMYNESADTLSYTSSNKKLLALSYHKFEIDVQTQNAPITISLVTKKDNEELVVASKTINTNNYWQTISLFVHAGYTDLEVALKLTLNSSAYAYAYADNAKFDYPLTSSQVENEFKSASNSNTSVVVDLTNPLESASTEKFAQTYAFNAPSMAGVESGTITFKSNYLDEVIDFNNGESNNNLVNFNKIAGNETDKKAISIWSTDDVAYKMTSNVGFTLTSGDDKYYKFSVDVFTQNIDTNNIETDRNLIGAGFGLSGYENAFTNIKSNNVWTTYSFYVKVDSTKTTYLELSLGSETAKTKGSVFFTNINFENVSLETYESVNENNFVKILKPVKTESDPENNPTSESTSDSNVNWFYLAPGLLTALAIIIAIVGVIIRKVKFKNPFKKKSKTTYDRNRTLSVQYYARKATTMREEKIRELNADWKKVNEERKQFEESYKKDLTKLREMKIKRANPAEISQLEKELKKNQKISANLGMTANRIIDELKYVNTDLYLNSLMKKLAREQANNAEETNDSN